MQKPLINIIILNWNGTNDTILCLKSVLKSDYENYKIILIDNGSSNKNLIELKEWCNKYFDFIAYYNRNEIERGGEEENENNLLETQSNKKIVFVENNENHGFAGGNNIALKYAIKKGDNFCLLLNNDTIIEPDSVTKLAFFLSEHPEYVGVTPQIRYYDPRDKIWNCGGKIIFPGLRKYYYSGKHKNKVPTWGYKDITFVTGCAFLFKVNETGLLSEKFFFGEEDFDLSWRLMKNRKKIACLFDSIIYHKVNISVKKASGNFGGIILLYTQRLINLKDKISKPQWLLYLLIQFVYSILMMKIRYKYSFRTVFHIWKRIFFYVKRYSTIKKDVFHLIISE